MGRLVIYGAGGFGREVLTAARNDPRELVLMSDEAQPPFDGVAVISFAELRDDDEVVIAVADAGTRRALAGKCPGFASVVAPTAIIGRQVEIGHGAILCDHSMVTTSAKIGRHFHCNIYSYVAHDCVIGDFVTFAPQVQCNGNVHVGSGAYIGSGAVLKNGLPDRPLIIGEGATVGCGAVVTRDVPAHATVVGNPAKPMLRVVNASPHRHVPRYGK
jgi:sugar O-acyltransferase (sialic acid O-acetyltransferase NeuD family)